MLQPVGGGDPIPLLKDRLLVGRRESSDICLTYQNVSSRHCELFLERGYWKVRDLKSTNGIKVNGERVIEKRVLPGDELSIAKHQFRLNYTPKGPGHALEDIDGELAEDVMKIPLLERAGLTRLEPDDAASGPGRRDDPEPGSRHEPGRVADGLPGGAQDTGHPEGTPPSSAEQFSDDEFLRIVEDEAETQNDEA